MTTYSQTTFRTVALAAAASEGPLDALTQQSLWSYAVRAKQTDIRAALALRADLDSEVASKCQSDKSADVRVSYLTNPATDMATVSKLLESESRASVLAGVCRQRTPEEVQQVAAVLLKRMEERPTKTLAQAVVPLPDLPAMLYARAVAVLLDTDAQVSWDSDSKGRLTDIAADRAAALWLVENVDPSRGAGGEAWWFWLVPILESGVLGDKDLVPVIRNFIPPAVKGLNTARNPGHPLRVRPRSLRFVESVAHSLVGRPTATVEATSLLRQEVESIGDLLSDGVRAMLSNYDPETIERSRAARDENLSRLLTCSDSAEILALTQRNRSDLDALTTLVTNPHLGEEHLLVLATYLTELGAYAEALKLVEKSRAARDFLVHLYATTAMWRHDRWESFQGDPLARRDTVIAFRSVSTQPQGDLRSGVLSLVEGAEQNDPCWLEVPWPAVESLMSSWQRHSPSAATLARVLLAKHAELAGSDSGSWETLAVLADNFQGTVGELAQAAAAV